MPLATEHSGFICFSVDLQHFHTRPKLRPKCAILSYIWPWLDKKRFPGIPLFVLTNASKALLENDLYTQSQTCILFMLMFITKGNRFTLDKHYPWLKTMHFHMLWCMRVITVHSKMLLHFSRLTGGEMKWYYLTCIYIISRRSGLEQVFSNPGLSKLRSDITGWSMDETCKNRCRVQPGTTG